MFTLATIQLLGGDRVLQIQNGYECERTAYGLEVLENGVLKVAFNKF